jgi:hypothetical protein
MKVVLSAAAGFGEFFYRFIVGDDWRVAAGMLAALAATAILTANHVNAWWLVPLLAILLTGTSLWRSSHAHPLSMRNRSS